MVKNSASTGIHMLVNHTPDVYDRHQEMTSGVTKQVVGNSIMISRATYRGSKNMVAIGAKGIEKASKHRMNKLQRKMSRRSKSNIDNHRKSQYWETVGNVFRNKSRKYAQEGLHPIASVKQIVSNQSRIISGRVAYKDDYATKTVGKFMQGMWGTMRYSQKFYQASKSIVQVIISSIVAFITSIPAMIVTIVSLLPVFIALFVAFCIFINIFNTAFEGRIGVLAGKLDELNEIYEVEFNPGELLAISDVLEWTTPDGEDYEILCSLMLDQTIGKQLTFEEMIDNVFTKYNPSYFVARAADNWNSYYEGWHKVSAVAAYTGWNYYSKEGWDISIITGGVDKKNISRSNVWEVYQEFARADVEEKKNYGSSEKIETLKQKARDGVATNLDKYNEYLSTIVIGNNGHGGATGIVDIDADVYGPYYSNNTSPFWKGNLVGQCTWYCWGRANEVNEGKYINLPTGNAGTWLYTADKQGFAIGEQPSANSIAVFASNSGYGHVAFVESYDGTTIHLSEGNVVNGLVIYPNSDIEVAKNHMATWSGTYEELQNRWGHKLLGFIYL